MIFLTAPKGLLFHINFDGMLAPPELHPASTRWCPIHQSPGVTQGQTGASQKAEVVRYANEAERDPIRLTYYANEGTWPDQIWMKVNELVDKVNARYYITPDIRDGPLHGHHGNDPGWAHVGAQGGGAGECVNNNPPILLAESRAVIFRKTKWSRVYKDHLINLRIPSPYH